MPKSSRVRHNKHRQKQHVLRNLVGISGRGTRRSNFLLFTLHGRSDGCSLDCRICRQNMTAAEIHRNSKVESKARNTKKWHDNIIYSAAWKNMKELQKRMCSNGVHKPSISACPPGTSKGNPSRLSHAKKLERDRVKSVVGPQRIGSHCVALHESNADERRQRRTESLVKDGQNRFRHSLAADSQN